MGFSTALQGRAAHEALVVRQDAELRLMEVMKRALQLRVKCDKEYAINLASVAQQGLKIDRADEMQGSLITKSWRSYMDELDHQSKQFKTNAELLEVVCEKLTHLSQDKRKARKTYQEEHTKIAARLNHLTDEVVRKKAEYQKHLEGYKALRTRFEEHYIKSGRGGRKLDDVRDKYQKACRKLHLTHNEYVLSITEAVEVEKDFRNILLPGLLEHQQSVQESFILLWKNILQEASQHGDLTSDKFKEIQKRIDNVISSVNPNEEYREFTEKHRTSPTSPVVFQFDEALIGDIPGKLQSSTLAVDNLTVDWLRTRLLDLELSVKDCQEKQLKMIEHVDAGAPVTANGSLSSNGTNGMQSSKESQHRQCKDLNALRCQEKQKQKLVDMIKFALNEVGCEELPSGCDDHLTLDQNFIEDSFNNHQQNSNSTSVSIMNELKRRGGVLTLLRGRHFKRKSTPQPTTPMTACRTKRFNTKMKPRSQSLGSLSVICPNTPYRYEPIFTNVPLRMAASDEANNNQDFLHDLSELKEDMYSLKFVPSKLRRSLSHGSVCVQVDVVRVVAEMRDDNNTNSHSMAMNNNHIYAELDLKEEREVNQEKLNEMKQHINPTLERTSTAKKKEKEQIKKIKENMPNQKKINEQIKQKSFEEKSKTSAIVSEVMQNSIDAHLDKIDALNRALDNRLKCAASPQQETDLDAIEFAELQDVVARSSNDTNQTSNKRVSTSNSDKEIRISDAVSYNVIDNKTKKRSLSFSQKSINALLCNIKEFSKSPLTKIHRSHDSKDSFPGSPETSFANLQKSHNEIKSNTEVGEVNPQKLSTTLPPPENHSVFLNNAIEPLHKHLEHTCIVMSNPSKIDTNLITSKLKFKVPKIQKKSKALRQTFRSKFLHFQLKRDNLCRTCTKKRRIYPSKSVFDFAKEFNLDGKSEDNEEFCTCPRSYHSVPKIMQNKTGVGDDTVDDDNSSDDVLSIKDHCYCVPSLSTSVSNGCLKNSASHYKLTCNAPQLNLLFTSSSNSFMCTLVVNRRHYSNSH